MRYWSTLSSELIKGISYVVVRFQHNFCPTFSSVRWSNKEVDKIDIAELLTKHEFNENEISIGMEMLKFIESKKEVGASNVELLVR